MSHTETGTLDTEPSRGLTLDSWRVYNWAGLCIGLAFGGFFDGILFHQILQWHSLLSSLDGEIFQDLRFRMLIDGVFHAAMYVVGIAGLALLWAGRERASLPGAGRRMVASLLIGFGVWHLLDAVLNHWILQLHHIRENENWLAWDLTLFLVGLCCLAGGIFVGRRGERDGSSRPNGVACILLAATLIASGATAAAPWAGAEIVTVVFRKNVPAGDITAAIASIDGEFLWTNPEGDIWAVRLADRAKAWRLYGNGAVFVSGSYFGMGCFLAPMQPAV